MAVQWPLTAKTAFVTALKLLQTVIVNNKQYQDITINAIQKSLMVNSKTIGFRFFKKFQLCFIFTRTKMMDWPRVIETMI